VADELRRQADIFVDLGDLAPHIARAHQPGRPAREERGRENHREAPAREPAPAMAPGDDERG
jgi:hypothetical protein